MGHLRVRWNHNICWVCGLL